METVATITPAVATTAEQVTAAGIDAMSEVHHETLATTADVIKAAAGEGTIAPDGDVADAINEQGSSVDAREPATGDVPTSQDEGVVSPLGVIDLKKKRDLDARYNALINNPRFWENPNRIKSLDDALNLPVYDDKSLQMFYNSASDELIKQAMEFAIKNKSVPVMPTEQQICALAEEKHYEKYVAGPKRKAEKEAKKNAKKYATSN